MQKISVGSNNIHDKRPKKKSLPIILKREWNTVNLIASCCQGFSYRIPSNIASKRYNSFLP